MIKRVLYKKGIVCICVSVCVYIFVKLSAFIFFYCSLIYLLLRLSLSIACMSIAVLQDVTVVSRQTTLTRSSLSEFTTRLHVQLPDCTPHTHSQITSLLLILVSIYMFVHSKSTQCEEFSSL